MKNTQETKQKTITREDWEKAGTWEEAIKGRKLPCLVSKEVYLEFLECLPPIEQGKSRASFINLPLATQDYFLVGEAYSHVNGKPVYACFARAFDTKYFFLGYLPREKSLLQFIEEGNEEEQEEWNRRAESGEVMRII
jgi:hypothetical protein